MEYYTYYIRPKLKEIDLLIKTNEGNIELCEASNVLSISAEELEHIMQKERIEAIDSKSFFKVMKHGSSEICKLFKREMECNSPYTYSAEDIAYIYNIDKSTVKCACENLNIKEITPYTLPSLFSNIVI